MDQQQQSRAESAGRQNLLGIGLAAVLGFLIIVVCGYVFGWSWTGLPRSEVNPNTLPPKTLWDWLDLLIVPVVLAVGGYLFTLSENQRNRDTAAQQAKTDREIADQRRQDDALQAYLDQIGQLLLDKGRLLGRSMLRRSNQGDEERTLARARTLTVLSRLDGVRKGTVVRFLYEAGLISRSRAVIDLWGADLRGITLRYVLLESAGLSGADLSGANLSHVNLHGADLSNADLSAADLRTSELFRASLEVANLSGANLSGVWMEEVNLWGATLDGADLSNANLRGSNLNIRTEFPAVVVREYRGIPHEELSEEASEELLRRAHAIVRLGREEIQNQELDYVTKTLKGATMPTGQKYEDWLKDKDEDWLDPEKDHGGDSGNE